MIEERNVFVCYNLTPSEWFVRNQTIHVKIGNPLRQCLCFPFLLLSSLGSQNQCLQFRAHKTQTTHRADETLISFE